MNELIIYIPIVLGVIAIFVSISSRQKRWDLFVGRINFDFITTGLLFRQANENVRILEYICLRQIAIAELANKKNSTHFSEITKIIDKEFNGFSELISDILKSYVNELQTKLKFRSHVAPGISIFRIRDAKYPELIFSNIESSQASSELRVALNLLPTKEQNSDFRYSDVMYRNSEVGDGARMSFALTYIRGPLTLKDSGSRKCLGLLLISHPDSNYFYKDDRDYLRLLSRFIFPYLYQLHFYRQKLGIVLGVEIEGNGGNSAVNAE